MITFSTADGSFEDDADDGEDVANAAPYQDYEQYLRANSSRLDDEPSSDEPTNTYGSWLAANGGK